MTAVHQDRHSGEFGKQLPFLRQDKLSQEALSTAFKCLPEQAIICLQRTSWNSPMFQILYEACKQLLFANNKFLGTGLNHPENCEAYSYTELRELWIQQDHSSECKRTKSQLQTFIRSQACHPCSRGSYSEITPLPSPKSLQWITHSFQEIWRKESMCTLGLPLLSEQ